MGFMVLIVWGLEFFSFRLSFLGFHDLLLEKVPFSIYKNDTK